MHVLNKLIGSLFICLFFTTPSLGQPKIKLQEYEALFSLTNTLVEARSKGDRLTIEEYGRSLSAACMVLDELASDEGFRNILVYYAKNQHNSDIKAEVVKIFQNYQTFLRFLGIERDILERAGISHQAVDHILTNVGILKRRTSNSYIDPHALLKLTRIIASETCQASQNIRDTISQIERDTKLLKISLFVGGAAMTIADVGIGLASLGLGAPIVVASGTVGTVMMRATSIIE